MESLGVTGLSTSPVSVMAAELDEQVAALRTRRLDAGPCTFIAADALVLKVREDGRVANVHALLATGVNADGHRRSSACRSAAPRTAPAGGRSSETSPPAG